MAEQENKRKKRLLLIVLPIVAVLLILAIVLPVCLVNGHKHNFAEENTDADYLKAQATCTTPAEYYYSCLCGEKGTQTFTRGTAPGHKYSDGVCSVCGDLQTKGIIYVLSEDGTYYTVSGIGTCESTEIHIAATYNGKPVVGIDASAFSDCGQIASVTIPSSVTNIGEGAFSGCTSLADVYYSGSESDWAEVTIEGDHNELTNATIHYGIVTPQPEHEHNYSETWSSDANSHWHACTSTVGTCDAPKKDEGGHKWDEGEITTPATAEKDGVKTFTCTDCGKTKTEPVAYVPPVVETHTHSYSEEWSSDANNHWHACTSTVGTCDAPKKDEGGHKWDEGEITTPATAEKDGVKTFTCTDCGKTKTEPVAYEPPVHTHSYSEEWSSDVNNHWHACTSTVGTCDAPKKDEGGHKWDEGEITTPATAEKDGVKTFTCTDCGKTKTEPVAYVPPVPETHTHSYSETWSSDANNHWHACTSTVGTCDAPKKDEGGHKWDEGEITTPATAEKDGVKTFTCTDCGKTKTEPVAYVPPVVETHTHSYSEEWSSDANSHWHACTSTVGTCDAPKKDEGGHKWDEGEITTPATAEKDGIKTFTCTDCGKTKTEPVAYEPPAHTHNYNQPNADSQYLASGATCLVAATYYYSCTCGQAGTETFSHGAALGHDDQYTNNNNGTHKHFCGRCEQVFAAAENHTLVEGNCTLCGEPLKLTLSDDGTYYIVTKLDSNYEADELKIPASFHGKPVKVIGTHALSYLDYVDSIVLPSSITVIEETAFYQSSGLKSVNIPAGVTSIGTGAFVGCSGLTSITIPTGITHWGLAAFAACEGLIEVELPNDITEIPREMFSTCTNLETITIPSSVQDIGHAAFMSCPKLTDVYYTGCEGQWNELTKWLFDYTENGALVNVPNKHFADHTLQEGTPVAPTCTTSGLTAGSRCTACGETVAEQETVPALGHDDQYQNNNNGTHKHFCSRCDYLVAAEAHTCTDGICVKCGGLQTAALQLTLSDDEQYYVVSGVSSSVPLDAEVHIPAAYNGLPVSEIGDAAFSGCSGITSIILPLSVTSIGANAFSGCSWLTNVYYSGCEGQWNLVSIATGNSVLSSSSVTIHAAEHTPQAGTPVAPTCTETGLTAGSYCSACGTTITVPEEVAALGHEGGYRYKNETEHEIICVLCGEVLVEEESHYLVDGQCACCYQPLILMLSDDKTYYTVTGVIYSFAGGEIVIPDTFNNRPVAVIGDAAFYEKGLSGSITISENVTDIGNWAFASCFGITEVEIYQGVESIGSYAFANCSGLGRIVIPASVTDIGECAFEGCSALETVYFGGTSEQWHAIVPENYIIGLSSAQIICLGD